MAVERGGNRARLGDACRVVAVDELRTLRRHAPVAVAVSGDDAVFAVLVPHVRHPTLHGGVVPADGLYVPIAGVEHVGHGDERARPGHIVGDAAPVIRADIRKRTGGLLRVRDVVDPFVVETVIVEDVRLAVVAGGAVAGPSHPLVALRTVGGHRAVVAPDAPVGVAIHGVHHLVGTLETARHGHLVVKHKSLEIFGFRFFAQTGNLYVPETVVREHRVPLPRVCMHRIWNYETVCGFGSAEIGGVEHAVGGEQLGKSERNRVALLQSAHHQLQITHHILSHVENPRVAFAEHRYRMQRVLHLDVGIGLRHKFAPRSVHNLG